MNADLLIIVFLLLCSAFFSASETGLTAVTRGKLYKLIKAGNRRAKKVAWLRERKERLIGTVLLGNNLVNIAATAIGTALAIRYFGDDGVVYATAVMTVFVLLFAEVLPKTYAIQNAERVALAVAPLVAFLVKVFSPVTVGVQWMIRQILRLFGVDSARKGTLISATDVIRGTIEWHHKEGEVVKQERDMLGSILDLGDIPVGDIMVHRNQVEILDAGLPIETLIARAIASTHSRIPFWQGNPENIIGVLHVKDLIRLLAAQQGAPLSHATLLSILTEPWFIPETTALREQLLAFRAHRRHFAHVVDEYGAFLGIVTLEDVLEEIVGQIEDEYDRRRTTDIVKEGKDSYVVHASMTIRDLNRELDWNLPDSEAATVGGLLLHEAQTIPEVGAVFHFHGYKFTVLEKKANQVVKVKLRRLKKRG